MDRFFKDLFSLFSLMKNKGKNADIGMDMPEGWVVQSDFPFQVSINSSFGLYVPLVPPTTTGMELVEHVKDHCSIGKKGINLFFNNWAFIPEDWRGRTLLFMGTIHRRLDGALFVECMYFQPYQKKWKRSYFCLSEAIGPFCAVPILKNAN
jgi:hypothetical protein